MQPHLFLLHSSSSPCPPPPASLSHFILLLDVSRPGHHRSLHLRWSRITVRREFKLSASRLTSVFQTSCDSFARSSFDVRATTFCSRWWVTSLIDLSSHWRCYLVEAAVDQTWARRVCWSAIARLFTFQPWVVSWSLFFVCWLDLIYYTRRFQLFEVVAPILL